MKKILNTIFYSKFFIALIGSIIVLSCDEYLDVDTDTDSPTVAPIAELLPGVQVGLSNQSDFGNFLGDALSQYVHQFQFREDQDQYEIRPTDINMTNNWNFVYLALTDMETLISQSQADGEQIYLGIAQLLKAQMMSVAVDTWGDIPYSEATQLESGIVGPVFDDQEVIYAALLALIDTGKSNVSSGTGTVPGANDLFYGGDVNKWVKYANTMKFRLLNQLRSTSLFSQGALDGLISENNFFRSSADDFQFTHSSTTAPVDERNSLFLASYGGTQFSYYQSAWFYEILKGWNPNIFTGNTDPRIPYYFVNQLQPNEFPPDQGDADTGDPHADYWERATGFHTIRFGSIGPDRDWAQEASGTYPGIFPSGGMYDDGSGPTIGIGSGTGVAPHRILTYDEFLYIQAELMQEGVISGNASEKLAEAMVASFAKVDEVVAANESTQSIPVLSGSAAVTTYMANVIAEFSAASAEKQLEIIMTQKWVSTFGDNMDQYSDYRRTGYPILANPIGGPSPEYQLDNGDDFPLDDGATTLNNNYQQSFFWPQSEINTNQNAPTQKDATTDALFWAN